VLQTMILIRLLFFSLVAAISVSGQTISGIVVDSETGQPLAYANVYINNTTFGVAADIDGQFKLIYDNVSNFALIISHTGYETAILYPHSRERFIRIKLNPISEELKEVIITADRDKSRNRNLRNFERYFLGSPPGFNCSIRDLSNLDVYTKGDTLFAHALAPIEIQNRTLGYQVFFDLKEFWAFGDSYSIKGYSKFQVLSAKSKAQEERWRATRQDAHAGSVHHFVKQIFKGDSVLQDWRMYAEIGDIGRAGRSSYFQSGLGREVKEVFVSQLRRGSTRNGFFVIFPPKLEIHYLAKPSRKHVYSDVYHQVSWIEVSGDTLFIDKNFQPMHPESISVSGDLGQRRIAELLPLDFSSSVVETPPARELVHIHFNKPYYYVGDHVWFKAYLNYDRPSDVSRMSSVLHLFLLNDRRKILFQTKLAVDDTGAKGGFELPNDIPPDNYYLLAFTRWMLNTDDYFIYRLPVLAGHEAIEELTDAGCRKNRSNEQTDEYLVTTDKETYAPYDSIRLCIQSKAGIKVKGNFSLSLVDLHEVVRLDVPTILDSTFIFANEPPEIRYKPFDIEKGIEIRGELRNAKNKPTRGLINAFQPDYQYFIQTEANAKGRFKLPAVSFFDSVSFLFQGTYQKKKQGVVQIDHQELAPPDFKDLANCIQRKNYYGKRQYARPDSTAKLLEEVVITAKKAVPAEFRLYGSPDHIVTGESIMNTLAGTNFLVSLQGRVPGLTVREYYDASGMKKTEVRIRGSSSVFNYTPPLVLVDGVPFEIEAVGGMTAEMVDRVEIVNRAATIYGSRGSGGIISIFTKFGKYATTQSSLLNQNYSIHKVAGFLKPTYFVPIDQSAFASGYYDPAVFWTPDLNFDGAGCVSNGIRAGGKESEYLLVIEGITDDQQPLRVERVIRVEVKPPAR